MPYEVIVGHPLQCVDEGSITVSNVAVGIPASSLDKAQGGEMEILLGVETDQVRLSVFAAATSASMLFDVGDKIRIAGAKSCRALSMIRATNDATVRWWLFHKAVKAV